MLQDNHYPRLTVVIKLHICLHHVIPMTRLLICYLQMAVFHLHTDALGIQYFTTYTLYHKWQTVKLFSDLIYSTDTVWKCIHTLNGYVTERIQ